MKLVVNRCFGGFGLSHEAVVKYAEYKGVGVTWTANDHGAWKASGYRGDCPTRPCTEVDLKYGFVNYTLANGEDFYDRDIPRDDPTLIRVVEELGERADGNHAELRVVEIPDGIDYGIEEYDGQETVAERHRTW